MTAEEISKQLITHFVDGAEGVELIKKYAKQKLDEAIQKGYHLDGDSDEKVVDVIDLIEIKNKI